MLLFLLLLVAYVFVRNFAARTAISGVLTLLSVLTFIAWGGIFNLVIMVLWGVLFFRDLRYLRWSRYGRF